MRTWPNIAMAVLPNRDWNDMTESHASLFAAKFTSAGKTAAPPYAGIRFDADGRFLSTPGNTVVCHVVPRSATADALLDTRERMAALPWSDRLAWTPPSSYHMTVFQGVIEGRRAPSYWPADLISDAPIDATTAHYRERLREFRGSSPFRMKIAGLVPLGLVLTGATRDDEDAIRAMRDALVEPFGYRHPDHDDYVFHITLAYLKDWLPEDSGAVWLPALETIAADFAARVPVIELEPPAFCAFDDMTEFRPLLMLE